MRRIALFTVISFLGLWVFIPGSQAETNESKFRPRVYLSETEALQLQMDGSNDQIQSETLRLSEPTVDSIRTNQRVKMFTNSYKLYKLTRPGDNQPYRYVLPIQQPGQHEHMDLMYGINADGTVNRIDLMVYREPYGGEVKSRRFMQQFEGKRLESSQFRVNIDVIHISGATISAKSVSRGTRKILAILKQKDYIP